LYEVPALEVSSTEPPAQNNVDGEVIVGGGNVFTVIVVTEEVALQPLALVTSTVYALAAVAVYVLAVPTWVVPLNHLYDAPALAVKTTEPPLQNVVEVEDEMVEIQAVDPVYIAM